MEDHQKITMNGFDNVAFTLQEGSFLKNGSSLGSFTEPKRKRSIIQWTREALPRLENYRNSKKALKRPSLGELHGGSDFSGDKSSTSHLDIDDPSPHEGFKLGWIQGVLIPCLSLLIIGISAVVCIITTLSLSAICTNGEVKGGGIYYIISRSLGPEFGASVGIVFSFANAVSASMNTIGFCNSLTDLLNLYGYKIVDGGDNDTRIIGTVAIFLMVLICAVGMDWESKAQNFLIAVILGAMVDFVVGTIIGPTGDEQLAQGFVGFNGCFAATLSTALTNLLSVPRLIQAIGVDKIYPGFYFFSKGYGKHGEPYRGYVLTFFVSTAFLLIAQLNAIAPLISNFYLASYALINFCTFHAALIKPLGWRPTFRMSTGALQPKPKRTNGTYNHPTVEQHRRTREELQTADFVTVQWTLRPTALLDFANLITKRHSLLIIGDVVNKPLDYKIRAATISKAYKYLKANKMKAFYSLVDNVSFEAGSKALLQTVGIGKLSPNVVMMGYKNDWMTCNKEELNMYFNVLHDPAIEQRPKLQTPRDEQRVDPVSAREDLPGASEDGVHIEKPQDSTIAFFDDLLVRFRQPSDNRRENSENDCYVTEKEIQALQDKTYRQLRLRDLLLENSSKSNLWLCE
nr:unnamed protein product [Callosobruchus chinensis]